MRGGRLATPQISPLTLRLFSRYARWYVRKNVHAVRILKDSFGVASVQGPLIICLNHPGWWDPLIALVLAMHLMPSRRHYAPIEAAALTKYRIFERIGFFGVEPGTAGGAAQFLRVGRAILEQQDAVLWITAQGKFSDVRKRPVCLKRGVGHLALQSRPVHIVPLALEYVFWAERFPEALCVFGDPVSSSREADPARLTALITAALEDTMERLARKAIAQSAADFELLLGGSAGIGGIYDVWRRLASRVRGETFRKEHGGGNI